MTFAAIRSTSLTISLEKKQLRFVTKWMCEKASILPGERIRDDCRKNLAKATALQIPDTCSTSDSESQGSITSLKDEVNQAETIVMVNSCLDKIGETPVTK